MLLQLLEWYEATDYLDVFEALTSDYERVNVQAYDYEGYVASVFNAKAYFAANMDLLRREVSAELFPPERRFVPRLTTTHLRSSRAVLVFRTPAFRVVAVFMAP